MIKGPVKVLTWTILAEPKHTWPILIAMQVSNEKQRAGSARHMCTAQLAASLTYRGIVLAKASDACLPRVFDLCLSADLNSHVCSCRSVLMC